MQAEVEQAELQLTQDKHRRLVVLRRQHFIQQLLRQRFAGLVVAGDKRQRVRLPAPVFHKLAWQLDSIPRHSADAGDACGFDAGQHVVQAVTELVEQGDHFIVGKQRRFAAHRTVEVTGQVGDRFLQGTIRFTHLAHAVVHPRPAALVLTRVEIEVEAAAQFVFLVIQLEEAHVRMPDVDIGTLFGGDAIDALHHFKQAVNGFVFREVRAQLLVADAVEVLLLFFAVVSNVPRLQLVHAELRFREGAQLGQLFFTLRTGAFRQIGQEVEHLLRVFRHFGGERFVGVVFKAQQLRQLVAQGEDFRHDRAVVPLTGIRPLIGGAGAIRAVHLFAKRLVFAVGHHRQIAWDIQG